MVLEIAKFTNFDKRVVIDSKGKVITNLTKEGIEKAMCWLNRGIIFTHKDANKKFEDYNNKLMHSDFI